MPTPTRRIARRLAPLAAVGAVAVALAAVPADAGPIPIDLSHPTAALQTPSSVNAGMRGVTLRPDRDVRIGEFQIEMAVHDASSLSVAVLDHATGAQLAKTTGAVTSDDVRSWRAVPLLFDFHAGHVYDVVFDLVPRLTFLDAYSYYSWDNQSLDPTKGFAAGPFTVLDGCGSRLVNTKLVCSNVDVLLPRVRLVPGGDTTPPVVAIAAGAEPADGWYGRAATGGNGLPVTVSATDTESLVDHVDCAVDGTATAAAGATLSLTLRDGDHTVSCTATDAAGNTSAPVVQSFAVDETPPSLSAAVVPDPVVLGGSADVTTASDDGGSGVSGSPACDAIDTTVPGRHSVGCRVGDVAGNVATVDADYDVVYRFAGFLRPVVDLPDTNRAKAGSAVPLKFTLEGQHGAGVVAAVVSSRCDGAGGEVAANGSLSYDSGQYVFVWKTDRAWASSCRVVSMRLDDGSTHEARFSFS